jgi:hypothetical protein
LFLKYFEKVGNEGFFEEVTLEPAIDEVIDDIMGPQKLQVLGDVRLADIEGFLEIAHALYSFDKFLKDLDARRMSKGL